MSNNNELDLQAQKDFNFTQNIRRNLVVEMTKKGPVPETKEDAQTMLQAMRDMDAQNIQRMRIKVEENVSGTVAGMASMVSAVLREVNPSAFAFINPNSDAVNLMAKSLPVATNPAVTVPGELAVNPAQGDYNTFITKMKE